MRYVITEVIHIVALCYMFEHSSKLYLSMATFAGILVIKTYAMLKFFTVAVLAIKVAGAYDD
jgi:hypothetical protein